MKLFFSGTSPYVRKVMVILHETGQLDDVEMLPSGGTPLNPADGLAAHNPLSKVPALIRDDAPALYDSRVICRYLDARAKAGLYGAGDAQWDLQTAEALCDGILDAALLMVYEHRLRPVEKQFEDFRQAQGQKIDQAVDAVWTDFRPLLKGPLNIAQIATGCALGYLDLRHGDRNWRQGRDGLADWYAEFEKRPAMQKTVPAA